MCYLDWIMICPCIWLNIISGCLQGYFWKRLTFELVGWVNVNCPPHVGRHYPIQWGLNRTGEWRKGGFASSSADWWAAASIFSWSWCSCLYRDFFFLEGNVNLQIKDLKKSLPLFPAPLWQYNLIVEEIRLLVL